MIGRRWHGVEGVRRLTDVSADARSREGIAAVEQQLHLRPPALDVAPEALRNDQKGERATVLEQRLPGVVAGHGVWRQEVSHCLDVGDQAPRRGAAALVEHRPRHVGRLVGQRRAE
jgi:hypothetical protein